MANEANHERYLLLANRMINKHGRFITLVNDAGSVDPNDPLGPVSPRLEIPNIKAVFIRPSGYIKLGESFQMDFGMFTEADKICLVVASQTNDYAKFTRVLDKDGSGYKIYKVEELAPGDVPILLYLGLKQ